MPPVFEADEVEFSYGPLKVLDGLSLTVNESEIFGVLGANGAGKTTLMRLLIGLQKPSSGAVRVFGEPASTRIAGRIGYMPQLSALYQELSVRQNVDFFARMYGLSRSAERREAVDRAIEWVDLTERQKDPLTKLSGGMRQRVSLAIALVHEPELLVLDEPTVGLDPELRATFWEQFRSMAADGATLIISSHTMDDAAHCHRLAFIQEGRVVALGSPDELREAAGRRHPRGRVPPLRQAGRAVSIDRTLAIAVRIVSQISRDHRSVALIIVAPIIVMSLVGFSFADQRDILNRIAPGLIGAFALFFVFLLTGVSFLRERSQGTLERLLTTPVGRADILAGYLLGFLLFAGIQSLVILLYTIFALRIEYEGSLWQIFVLLFVVTIVAVNLGIFISTFARNEFQVVQFIPIMLLPQIFLSGAVLPFEQLPGYFQAIGHFLPLTYAVDGLKALMLEGETLGGIGQELAVLGAFAIGILALAAITVRRT